MQHKANNMKAIRIITLSACLCFIISLSGCIKDENLYQAPTPAEYFSFNTTKDCPVSIDLGLENYPVLVEVYSENPFDEKDGITTPKIIEPIYRGITDASGKLEGFTTLPSLINKVYVYSPYIGTPFLEAEVTANGIQANAGSKDATRTATRAMSYTYPSDMMILGEWDINGYPAYLNPKRYSFPENELYHINKATKIEEYKLGMKGSHPEYFGEGISANIPIVKKTKVNLVMIGKYAQSSSNTIVYFTYPTGQLPTSVDDIQKVIAYPTSKGISCGSNVQLRYWNKDKGVFEDEFPAGVSIGWNVYSNGLDANGNISKTSANSYYSIAGLNTKTQGGQYFISLYDQENNAVIIGIEDRKLLAESNYTDVVLYCTATEPGAIGGSNSAPLIKGGNPGPQDADNYTTYFGELAFEDQWPSQGDYDMNDAVIHYESKVFKNMKNQIVSIEDKISPRSDGAGRMNINGFGYQLSVSPSQVASMQISCDTYTFPENPIYQFDSKGLETNNGSVMSKATIIVTENIKANVADGSSFVIKTTFGSPQAERSFLLPPYNPFLIINAKNERGCEVHLPNYAPTQLADKTLFGTKMDVSDDGLGLYYISKDNMPYAIHLPSVEQFNFPDENMRIDEIYPAFSQWVQSGGTAHKDWYLNKKK